MEQLIILSILFISFNLPHYPTFQKRSSLTSIVNFPVSSSECRGSLVGSNLVRPSRCLVSSCCSKRASDRATSNLRAKRNLTAIDHVTGPNLRRNLAFTFSMNSLVAWNKEDNAGNRSSPRVKWKINGNPINSSNNMAKCIKQIVIFNRRMETAYFQYHDG